MDWAGEASEESEADGLWAEVSPRIDAAIAALAARQREAVVQHFLAGRSIAEAAREMDRPARAVGLLVRRGVEGVRRGLARQGLELSPPVLLGFLRERMREEAPAGLAAAIQAQCFGEAPVPERVAELARAVEAEEAGRRAAVLTLLAVEAAVGPLGLARPRPRRAAGPSRAGARARRPGA